MRTAGLGNNRGILVVAIAVAAGVWLVPQSNIAQSLDSQGDPSGSIPMRPHHARHGPGGFDAGKVVPLPPNTEFRPRLVTAPSVTGATSAALQPHKVGEMPAFAPAGRGPRSGILQSEKDQFRDADFAGTVVYSNRLGNGIFAPGGGAPGWLVADDIATLATEGCILESLRFRVSGDPLGDGSGVGAFGVEFALYSGCPSAGGFPLFTPVMMDLPDNGNYEVIYQPDIATEIEIRPNAYFGVRFSRSVAGIVVGAPAMVGFSADRFDFPGASCQAFFGGLPQFDHASFDLEIRARNDCPEGVCSSTCSGGENDGDFCLFDDCPGGTCKPDIACLGGPNNGGPCDSDADCPSICSGGSNPGNPCASDNDCINACRGGTNQGNFCVNNDQCPGSDCSIGQCPVATCTRDQCVGGVNSGDFCLFGDCPSGSCDGAKACDGGSNADQACVYGCVPSFPAYKNTSQGRSFFTSQPANEFFADDIRLAIPVDGNNPCMLTSWEVGFKGGLTGNGAVQAELHTFLDNGDPQDGGRIPGTRVTEIISGTAVRILKKTFDPPIPITQRDLFVVFKTSNQSIGAIKTCRQAEPGSTEDTIRIHDGSGWQVQVFESGCIAAFEVTLSCAGAAPSGACCDMVLTENRVCIGGPRDGLSCNRDSQCRVCIGGDRDGFVCFDDDDCAGGVCPALGGQFCVGDAVCRDVPEWNCSLPTRWVPGSHCGPVCEGGANHDQACVTDADCPGACAGGLTDTQACDSEAECPGVCEGSGPRDGDMCWGDVECQLFPESPNSAWTCALGSCGAPGLCGGSFCVDGERDGLPCTRALDCPNGDCVGQPFDYGAACGVAACCAEDMGCRNVTEAECNEFDGPVRFLETVLCDVGIQCPFGACLARDGECTIPRPGEVGCESPVCCTDVCEFDAYCCEVEWDDTCVRWVNDFCFRVVANDSCEDAIKLDIGDSIVVAGRNASGGTEEPGFCCYQQEHPGGPGPGTRAAATVWYAFVATETSARISTCNSAPPVEDTLVQVFSVGELDSGLCEDQSVCSVSASDCLDESECVLNKVAACGSLSSIACNDNASGCGAGKLADVCVTALVPGETYYVMVGGKHPEDVGLFDVAIDAPCTLDVDPLPNDLCVNAVPLDESHADCKGGTCSVPFDLAGFGFWAPATFDCPGPNCLQTMEHDVWYDWTAPATGWVWAETCDGENTPDTSLVLYDGCDCPPEIGTELSCSETELDFGVCFLGSRVSAAVVGGQCYKFRLGGNFSSFPSGFPTGTLDIDFSVCPPGPISILDPLNDPPDQTIDARAPLDPLTGTPLGIDSFTVKWQGAGTSDPACYEFCETPVAGFDSNGISGTITDNGDGTFTVPLARPIAPGAWGTLTVKHGHTTSSQITVVTLPGDADGDGSPTPADLDFLVAGLNGEIPFDKYRHDMDHNGALTPRDLLRWIDVTQGVSGAFDPWLNAPIPECAPCCAD